MEQENKTQKPQVVLVGYKGHIGKQAVLAEMLKEVYKNTINIIVVDVENIDQHIRRPKDLMVFVDVMNPTSLVHSLPMPLSQLSNKLNDKNTTLQEILDIYNSVIDINKTIRERLLAQSFSDEDVEKTIALVTEQRKRKTGIAYRINDADQIENSLMHMRQLIKVFFKSQVPAP